MNEIEIRDAVHPERDYLKVEDTATDPDGCFIVAYEDGAGVGEEHAIKLNRAGMLALRDELDRRLGDGT